MTTTSRRVVAACKCCSTVETLHDECKIIKIVYQDRSLRTRSASITRSSSIIRMRNIVALLLTTNAPCHCFCVNTPNAQPTSSSAHAHALSVKVLINITQKDRRAPPPNRAHRTPATHDSIRIRTAFTYTMATS